MTSTLRIKYEIRMYNKNEYLLKIHKISNFKHFKNFKNIKCQKFQNVSIHVKYINNLLKFVVIFDPFRSSWLCCSHIQKHAIYFGKKIFGVKEEVFEMLKIKKNLS